MSIKVLLADDHAVLLDGLRLLLDMQDDIIVIGDANNGRLAVQRVNQLRPHIVIMDVVMPELNGIEATRQIALEQPNTKVIMLSMNADSEYVFRALQAGARGYLVKASAGSEVVQAVRAVHKGRRYLSHEISETVLDAYIRQREIMHQDSILSRLSSRELEVFQLVVEGVTSREIAKILSISPETVKTYRKRVMKKLNIKDLPSLVKFAVLHGITPLE